MIDGAVHHFGVCGLANGLAVLADEETRSYWDHITGEAFEGPRQGQVLPVWPIALTTVEAALGRDRSLQIFLSDYRSPRKWLMEKLHARKIDAAGFLPPPFRLTMAGKIDPRLDKLRQGLGVIDGDGAKFYPMDAIVRGGSITDTFMGRPLKLERDVTDGVPFARWEDSGEVPMQLLTRWYGFAFTYPGCEIFQR